MLIQTKSRTLAVALLMISLIHCGAGRLHAAVALLMEEPYGEFGAMNPTGHAAVYLDHVCAETPTRLRMCHDGEFGIVISRYHKMDGYDWVAMPLIPYLYAVDSTEQIPASVDRVQAARLRNRYREEHLLNLAPGVGAGNATGAEWTQLVGSTFDRKIYGFELDSTPEEDARFISIFNQRQNIGHFNLFFHNCADFSRVVLDTYFPHSVHRNFVADLGLMTPKQAARSFIKYGKKHPERNMCSFIIPQLPGSIPRSHPVDGVAESIVRSKKYLLPMMILTPEVTGGVIASYLIDGRMRLPKDVHVFQIKDQELQASGSTSISEFGAPSLTNLRSSIVPE